MSPDVAGQARQGSRLDRATLTVSVYPTCGEASVSVAAQGLDRDGRLRELLRESELEVAARTSVRGAAVDPVRSLESSVGRSRRKVRRWCTHHQATRLATLTFAVEPGSLDEGWAAVEGFRRRLDAANIKQPCIVPENGSRGGRLHFHAAMPEFVDREHLASLWGHGFVDIRKLKPKKLSRGSRMGGRDQARLVAGYVAAYIAKGQKQPAGAGGELVHAGPAVSATAMNRRRYSIPKASSPEPVRFSCWSLHDAYAEIEDQCGYPLRVVWESPETDDWPGPPCQLLMG